MSSPVPQVAAPVDAEKQKPAAESSGAGPAKGVAPDAPKRASQHPVSADTLAAMIKRAKSEEKAFQAAANTIVDQTDPAIVLGSPEVDTVAQGAANDVYETIVKPGAIAAAVTKLRGENAVGESLKQLLNKGKFDQLGMKAAAPLLQERLDQLTKEADPTAVTGLPGGDVATLAERLAEVEKIKAAKGTLAVKYLTPEQKAQNLRARAKIADKNGALTEDALVTAGRQLTRTLLDARLSDLVESDPVLPNFYRPVQAGIAARTKAAVRGHKELVGPFSRSLADDLRRWGLAMSYLQEDIAAAGTWSEAEIEHILGSISQLRMAAQESVPRVAEQRRVAVDGVRAFALKVAAADAETSLAAAEKAIIKHIGENAKSYAADRKDVDEQVKSDLESLGAAGPMTAEMTATVAKAKAEINSSLDTATSRFASVGKGLDLGLSKSKAGSSLSTDVVIQIPVPAFPGAFIGVRLHVEASSSHETGKETRSVGAEIGLQFGGKLPLAAQALAELGGYFKATGATAAEAMEYVSYALFRRFRESNAIPREITDSMWGAGGVTGASSHSEANAWGAGMEKRLAGDKEHSVETGGYVAGRAEIGKAEGTGLAGIGLGVSGDLVGSAGKRYTGKSIQEAHDAGRGREVAIRGAQDSVGEDVRTIKLGGAVSAGPLSGSAEVASTWVKPVGGKAYEWEGIEIKVSGAGSTPAKDLLDGNLNSSLTIMNWTKSLLSSVKGYVEKTQEKEKTEIAGATKANKTWALKGTPSLAHSINAATGAQEVEKGWLESVKANAHLVNSSGAAHSGVVGAVKGAAGKVTEAVTTTSALTMTAAFSAGPHKPAALKVMIASQKAMTIDADVVNFKVTKTGNLVTVLLLPTPKVLL